MVGVEDSEDEAVRRFLNGFTVAPIDEDIRERTVKLRRSHKLRLPHALIWATAQANQAPLVTWKTRDFPISDPGVREPYRI